MNSSPFSDLAVEAFAAVHEEQGFAPPPEKEHRVIYKPHRPSLNPVQGEVYDTQAKFILAHGEKGSGKCLSEDSIAYVNGGLKRMRRLRPSDQSGFIPFEAEFLSWNGTKLLPAKSSQFYNEQSREGLRINFDNGNHVSTSLVHPLWCELDGDVAWRTATEIAAACRDGKTVHVPLVPHTAFRNTEFVSVDVEMPQQKCHCGRASIARGLCQKHYEKARRHGGLPVVWKVKKSLIIDEGVGYLLGALCGDGSLNITGDWRSIGFANQDKECICRVRSELKRFGTDLTRINGAKDFEYKILHCSELRQLVEICGLACLSKHKRIPDHIIESPAQVIKAFLRGLYDTDGTVERTGTVILGTSSEQLSQDVQDCLQAIGIFAVRRFKANNHAGCWSVYCFGEEARNFVKHVGFEITRKRERIVTARFLKRNKYSYPASLVREMYDLRVKTVRAGRKPTQWKPFKIRRYEGKRGQRETTSWMVCGKVLDQSFRRTFHSEDSAKSFAAEMEQKRRDGGGHTREWHDDRKTVLMCRHIPNPKKLRRFKDICGTTDKIESLSFTDRWVKVISTVPVDVTLCDVAIPETQAFVANGIINHNTIGALHKLVAHCRESFNALAIIITGVKRQAEEGGAWHKLLFDVLPEWKRGCGMIIDGPHGNIAKDVYVWVSNRHGGWSRILLLSMPVEGFLPDRFRGPEPTFVLVDEAQGLASDNYFKIIVMQVGRRKDVPLQQVIYCCNPDGPSHWLYKRFFIYPMATGKWDKRYAVFHVPVKENIKNLPPRYYEDNVLEACRGDDIEYRRMVLGEWIDAPSGEALFKEDYKDDIHGRGDFIKSIGFLPVKGVPITTGFDLGAAHTSIHFQQIIATKDRIRWLIFDELNFVDQYVPYPKLVPKILERMEFWKTITGHDFKFQHISDNSAFNQYRATTGSFDVQDIERFSGGKIKLLECPKGPHSVEARVRITKEKLHEVDVLLSGSCLKTREMFMHLEQDKDNAMKPKRSRFLHPFDSMTYPHLYYNVRRNPAMDVAKMEPQYYAVGA